MWEERLYNRSAATYFQSSIEFNDISKFIIMYLLSSHYSQHFRLANTTVRVMKHGV